MLGTYHLQILYEIVKDLQFLYETDRIYPHLLENIIKALDAEAATIYLADAQKEHLQLKACWGPKKSMIEMIAEEMPFEFGEGVAGWCARFNQPLIVENAQKEPRFNPRWDTLTGFKTKTILCAPISNKEGVLGVIEVLNKKGSLFNQNDQDVVVAIAKQTAIAMENSRLYKELHYSKNFSDGILANLSGGFIAMNNDLYLTHLNPQAEKFLKITSSECVGRPAGEALKNYPLIAQKLVETLASKEKSSRKELTCERPDKTILNLGYSAFPIEDQSKKILGAAMIFQDLASFSK